MYSRQRHRKDSARLLDGAGDPRNDLARLFGRRLVTASEVPRGHAFDEALVKQLTGGDRVPARFLHREFFEYVPKYKIWIAGNHRPAVSGDEDALWRRLVPLPFSHEVPEAQRDDRIKAHLCDLESGAIAMFAWAVDGCSIWQEEPLKSRRPVSVQVLIAEYRKDSDTFGRFVEDCLVVEPEAWMPWKRFASTYREWCRSEGVQYPLGDRSLRERLRRLGATDLKLKGERGWRGVGEKPRTSPVARAVVDSTDRQDSSSAKFPIEGPIGEFADQLSGAVQLSRPTSDFPLLGAVAGRKAS